MKIRGSVCNKRGNEGFKAILGDVAICLNAKYNLFGVTNILQNDWSLSGDKDTIVLKKGPCTIRFDIKISTPEGALYCMYFKRASDKTLKMKKLLQVNLC